MARLMTLDQLKLWRRLANQWDFALFQAMMANHVTKEQYRVGELYLYDLLDNINELIFNY